MATFLHTLPKTVLPEMLIFITQQQQQHGLYSLGRVLHEFPPRFGFKHLDLLNENDNKSVTKKQANCCFFKIHG